MYRSFLFLLVICACSFSQTVIPPPSSHPTAQMWSKAVNIGDFDGDGSDDLFGAWYEPTNSQVYYVGIYSMKKGQFLLFESTAKIWTNPDAVGDFDGDKIVEIVLGNAIYKFSGTVAKKKIQ